MRVMQGVSAARAASCGAFTDQVEVLSYRSCFAKSGSYGVTRPTEGRLTERCEHLLQAGRIIDVHRSQAAVDLAIEPCEHAAWADLDEMGRTALA